MLMSSLTGTWGLCIAHSCSPEKDEEEEEEEGAMPIFISIFSINFASVGESRMGDEN